MKIGVNLYSIRNMITNKNDLTKTLKLLKKHGCDFVQFSGSPVPLTELKEISKKTKMPIILTHSSITRILYDTKALMKEHKSFNCTRIGLGMIPNRTIYADDKKVIEVINRLEKVAKEMEKNGFKFFYHNHQFAFRKLKNGKTIFEYMYYHTPHINFTLDTYWVQYGGLSLVEMIRGLKGRIECVHLKDYSINKKLEPEFAPLGDGNINFKRVVKEAKKAGTKYFFIEQDNAATKKDGFKDIIRSIKYAKEVL